MWLNLFVLTHTLRMPPASLLSSVPRCRGCTMAVDLAIMQPTAELSFVDTVQLLCDGMKNNNEPHKDAGMERLYHFTQPMGRVAMAPPPPRSGLQGGVTLEYFLESAASAALGSLILCDSFKIVGDATVTPGTNHRGSLATVLVEVGNSPLEDDSDKALALEALCGAPDEFLEEVLQSERDGTPLPSVPEAAQVKARFWLSFEQERRPPLQDCWLLKEMLPCKKTEWQRLNEGGEEFEGDDPPQTAGAYS
jgi:hypothetical protein